MSASGTGANAAVEECWKRIGVTGDRSCAKLEAHVHCRNCDTYAAAARHSLARQVDDSYRDDWARQLRQVQAGAQALDQSGLVFRIGAEWLMLPTTMVRSIAPHAPAHRLPHRASAGLAGIVNVAGAIAPAIAMAELLGIDGADAGAASTGRHVFARLVLLAWEGQSFAMPVADLHGIVRYATAALHPPAATINKGLQRYLAGVLEHQGMMVGVLDAGLIGHQMTRLLR